MRRTKIEAEQTREALLDAAEAVFWMKGVTRTTLNDVARAAGTTRGAIYHHFRGKADLLNALLDRRRFPQEEELARNAADLTVDPLDSLHAICRSALELLAVDTARQRLLAIMMHRCESLGELQKLADRRRDEILRSQELFARLLGRAAESGRLSPTWSPRIAALTLHSIMIGLCDQWLRHPHSFDLRGEGVHALQSLFASFETMAPTPKTRRRR
ncbi:MAG: TetR family transcriptional regulator [Hyphomicrobiaceae bacterium]